MRRRIGTRPADAGISTMAATGILYVEVVAVVIGEVLGGWLSAVAHVPL